MIFKRKVFRNFSKSASSSDLYILSAVRTPVGLRNGALREFTAPQLVSFVIKEVLQRGIVPIKDLQSVFLTSISHSDCRNEIMKRAGLSNTTRISLIPAYGLNSLSETITFLQNSDEKVAVAGGMESLTNATSFDQFFPNLTTSVKDLKEKIVQDYIAFTKANENGAFIDEIVKIDFRKKGRQIVVDDEVIEREKLTKGSFSKYFPTPGDGAAAAIISDEDYLTNNNLTPIGKILSFSEESNTSDMTLAIEKALKVANCQSSDIHRWEIISPLNNNIINLEQFCSINPSQINKDGGVLSLGYPIGMLGIKTICHLIHSLPAGKLGCAASCDLNGSASSVIVKKFGGRHLDKPQLTLFTKFPCPLCDELKEELELFKGRFLLTEVDIEREENEKYKELYQYEIPVLFFNGQFLCKHRLSTEQFRDRLLMSENSVN